MAKVITKAVITRVSPPAEVFRCIDIARERARYCDREAAGRAEHGNDRAAAVWDSRAAEANLLAEMIEQEFSQTTEQIAACFDAPSDVE